MIKTFMVLKFIDSSWTGSNIKHYDNFMEIMDDEINQFQKENNIFIDKIDYSFVNQTFQHGSYSLNVDRKTFLFASVHYTKK